jgi:hypothetical protein
MLSEKTTQATVATARASKTSRSNSADALRTIHSPVKTRGDPNQPPFPAELGNSALGDGEH